MVLLRQSASTIGAPWCEYCLLCCPALASHTIRLPSSEPAGNDWKVGRANEHSAARPWRSVHVPDEATLSCGKSVRPLYSPVPTAQLQLAAHLRAAGRRACSSAPP